MKKKKGSAVLKLFLVVLSLYVFYKVADIKVEMADKQRQLDDLERQVEEQQKENAQLEHILSAETNEEYMEKIAREKLGFAFVGERIFINGG